MLNSKIVATHLNENCSLGTWAKNFSGSLQLFCGAVDYVPKMDAALVTSPSGAIGPGTLWVFAYFSLPPSEVSQSLRWSRGVGVKNIYWVCCEPKHGTVIGLWAPILKAGLEHFTHHCHGFLTLDVFSKGLDVSMSGQHCMFPMGL